MPDRIGKTIWCRPAYGRCCSLSTPTLVSTRMPAAAASLPASASSADFPHPGFPVQHENPALLGGLVDQRRQTLLLLLPSDQRTRCHVTPFGGAVMARLDTGQGGGHCANPLNRPRPQSFPTSVGRSAFSPSAPWSNNPVHHRR